MPVSYTHLFVSCLLFVLFHYWDKVREIFNFFSGVRGLKSLGTTGTEQYERVRVQQMIERLKHQLNNGNQKPDALRTMQTAVRVWPCCVEERKGYREEEETNSLRAKSTLPPLTTKPVLSSPVFLLLILFFLFMTSFYISIPLLSVKSAVISFLIVFYNV